MAKRRLQLIIVAAVLMGLALLGYQYWMRPDNFSPGQTISIASGEAGGAYDRFARTLPTRLRLPVESRNSAGSLENIELLRSRQVDYAIVQSDIAHYALLGERRQTRFSDLVLVMPLFPEFVQIVVPANSGIRVLNDLRGRRVCLGREGSGTYFNSVDILTEASLRETVDFVPVYSRTADCFRDLLSGSVDVVFATSNQDHAAGDPRLRQLYLSDSMLRSLTARHSYFRIQPVARNGQPTVNQLAVDALLVTHASQSPASVNALTRQLIRSWDSLGAQIPGLIRPGSHARGRIPFHGSAQSALISMGVQQPDYYFYVAISVWTMLLLLCFASERAKTSYNRLGESKITALGRALLVKQIGRVSHLFIALTSLLLFFAIAVYGLLLIEDFYAQRAGTVSPFATMDFFDSILWLFTYIASGFTADGIYPVSVAGKIIVAILAIVGLVAPITAVIFIVNMTGRKAQRRMQGLGRTNLSGHVVVCGWNEKVPNLIYTLTGKDVDQRMKVVLVGEMAEEYPLEKYGFNSRYVTYCRGDTAEPSVLRRASIEQAGVVLVMADFSASKAHNRKTILTVMNVRRVNKKAYICAEIEYIDNVDFYQAGGCDSLIYPSLIISRLATATVLSPMILDYVLDVITYHEFDELRSAPVGNFDGLMSGVGRPVAEIQQRLLHKGINLVGVLHGDSRSSLHDTVFGENEQRGALLSAKDRNQPLEQTDILVYSAKDNATFKLDGEPSESAGLEGRTFAIAYPHHLRVLVCADGDTIAMLKRGLSHVIKGLHLVSIDITAEPLRYIEQIDRIAPGDFDRVVVLAPQARRSELTSFDDLNEIDADLILTTRLLRATFRQRGRAPTIIAEITNIQNKPLLLDEGADVVLPALLATERFFTKEAYDRNNVTDFLMAALNLEDGIHLHNHTVREGDGFCGESYRDLLATPIEGLKILGWLPFAERDELTNREGDFKFHFRTVIDGRLHHLVAEPGDEIIMMIEKRRSYRVAKAGRPRASSGGREAIAG